jgi:hypothetical protein
VAEGETLALSQEMTIGRGAFLANLPAAVPGIAFEVAGNEVRARDGERRWRIALMPLPDLCLGALRLPRHRVEIWLAGYDPSAQSRFLERFELAFRRAGG